MKNYPLAKRGDPSAIAQKIVTIPIKIYCCRFWQLQRWNCRDSSFSYWRIYWNANEGGVIGYENREFQMKTDCIYIIPPNTAFYSYFKKSKNLSSDYDVVGKRIEKEDIESEISKNSLLHLYIHFKLGMPYDYVSPNIYELSIKDYQIERIRKIAKSVKESNSFSISTSLEIKAAVFKILSCLDNSIWQNINIDTRVMKTIDFIDKNIERNFGNEYLANQMHMTTNGFSRLFKREIKTSLQQFIKKRKIENACRMFDQSNISITEASEKLGFADRYHFSRIFKQVKGLSPGKYINK